MEFERLVDLRVVADHDTADHIGVPTKVLGAGVQHEIGAKRKRVLQKRRGERVVDDEQSPMVLEQVGDAPDVDDFQIGVRRCLGPDQPGFGPDRSTDLLQVTHVDQGVVDAVAADDFGHKTMGAAVGVVGENDMVTGSQEVGDVLCSGQTAGVSEPPGGPFQGGHDILQRGAGGIVSPAVFVRAELIDALLHEGAGLVDRCGDGAGRGVGLLPGVNGARLESGSLPIGGHAYYSPKNDPPVTPRIRGRGLWQRVPSDRPTIRE